MKYTFYKKSCILLLIGLLFQECKTREKTIIKPLVDNRPAFLLYKKQQENEFRYKWFSAKADISSNINGEDQSFNANIRIRKDSLIWLSISPALGIEVARVLITSDSVKMLNRLNSTYFAEDICRINDLINADFDFEMIQNLLVGNSFEYYSDDRLKTSVDENRYLLSSYKKRRLKRIITKSDAGHDPVQSIWLDPSNFKIVRLLLNDLPTQRELDARFSNFNNIDSLPFAHHIEASIKAQKQINVNIDYSKVKLNEEQSIPFKVPEKYKKTER